MTTQEAVTAYVLAVSDRADAELAARLEAWRDGWRAHEIAQGEQYMRGVADGILYAKHIQHGIYRELQHLGGDLGELLGALRAAAQ